MRKQQSLIQEHIQRLLQPAKQPVSLLDRIFRVPERKEVVVVDVRAPQYFFLRADVFIDDIAELCEEDEIPRLTIHSLIAILFDNFLQKIRRGVDCTKYLKTLKQHYSTWITPPSELQRRGEGHWVRKEKKVLPRKERLAVLHFSVLKKSALRAEVFLYDLRRLDPEFRLNLDELVSLLFLEFLEAIQNGDVEEVMRTILEYWIDFSDEEER